MALMEITLEFELKTSNPTTIQAPPALPKSQSELVLHHLMYDEGFSAEREALGVVKTKLDQLDDRVYYATRDELFPLAHSGGNMQFQNRAGHKLKETMDATGIWELLVGREAMVLDSVPGRQHRDDKKEKKKKKKGKPKTVAFADVCGGPGAFSQLLYQTCPRGVKLNGFGMTLLDEHLGAPQGWYPDLTQKKGFIACFGMDGQGNIYNTSNIIAFHTLVVAEPLKLVVADGGFDVPSAQANIQEVISARIVYGQWFTALKILKPGGCFVLKLFDTFSPFTRSLLWLSTKFWEKVHIVKPKHSRIVNSERYLVCLGLHADDNVQNRSQWMNYLTEVHRSGFTDGKAMLSVVPVEWMTADAEFTSSVGDSIKEIATRQIKALEHLLASDALQENLKRQEEWKQRAKERDAARYRQNATGAQKVVPQYSAHLDPGVAAATAEESQAGQKRGREEYDDGQEGDEDGAEE